MLVNLLRRWIGLFWAGLGTLLHADAVNTVAPARLDSTLPLPSVESILQKVATQSAQEPANDRSFAQHYGFVRWKRQQELDSKGQVSKTTYTIATNLLTDLVEAYPGSNPQGAAVDKASPLKVNQPGQTRGRAVNKRDIVFNEELLKRFKFTLLGREDLEGRPMFLVRFQPQAHTPTPKNLKDRFLKCVTGQLWVDEQTSVIAKIDLNLDRAVDIAAGLAGTIKHLHYTFQRAITPEGWWYVRQVHWELKAKAVMSRKHVLYEEARTNLIRLH